MHFSSFTQLHYIFILFLIGLSMFIDYLMHCLHFHLYLAQQLISYFDIIFRYIFTNVVKLDGKLFFYLVYFLCKFLLTLGWIQRGLDLT